MSDTQEKPRVVRGSDGFQREERGWGRVEALPEPDALIELLPPRPSKTVGPEIGAQCENVVSVSCQQPPVRKRAKRRTKAEVAEERRAAGRQGASKGTRSRQVLTISKVDAYPLWDIDVNAANFDKGVREAVAALASPEDTLGRVGLMVCPSKDEHTPELAAAVVHAADVEALLNEFTDIDATELKELPLADVPLVHLEAEIPIGGHKGHRLWRRQGDVAEKELQQHFTEFERLGIVRKVEPTWIRLYNPAFLVTRKYEQLSRPIIDLRRLNQWLRPQTFPLPSMERVMEGMAKATLMSEIDITLAYFAIPIDEESQRLCGVWLPEGGAYVFTRLPMGCAVSPPIFQAIMTNAFAPIEAEGVAAFFDNISVGTNGSRSQHLRIVRQVLLIMRKLRLRCKRHKLRIAVPEIVMFGYELGRGIKRLAPSLRDSFRTLRTPPTTKRRLVAALAALNFISSSIPMFAAQAAPFRELCSGARVRFTEEQEAAWTKFVDAVLHRTDVAIFQSERPIRVTTDWSGEALGGVLEQYDGAQWRLVSCVSRKCDTAERNYAAHKGELTALDWVLGRLACWLMGRHFLVRSDCMSLLYLTTTAPVEKLVMRQLERLARYSFAIEHVAGVDNVMADLLSRQVCDVSLLPQMEYCGERIAPTEVRDVWNLDAANDALWRPMLNPAGGVDLWRFVLHDAVQSKGRKGVDPLPDTEYIMLPR